MLKKFQASNFQGNCVVDEDFIPTLEKINNLAIKHNIIIIVTSSYRKDANVRGAIVTPSKKSNHMIGQAIDFNLKNSKTGEYFNSTKLADDKGLDEIFMQEVAKETGVRWGDSFSVKDSVHIDTGLNVSNPVKWQQKYNKIHGV